jgi:hypothetical protein
MPNRLASAPAGKTTAIAALLRGFFRGRRGDSNRIAPGSVPRGGSAVATAVEYWSLIYGKLYLVT